MTIHEIDTSPVNTASAREPARLWAPGNLIVAAILVIALAMILMPSGFISVFDGRYNLTIAVRPTDQINPASLLFATCWTSQEAQAAVTNGTDGNSSFAPGTSVAPDTYVISVPYSGRTNSFGRIISYHQSQHLVIQYDLTSPAGRTVRRRVPIPQGRGDRSMKVTVP